MEKNLRNIKQQFKENGIYYTTSELAETLKAYADFEPKRIYDPTCGQGNLLAVFPDNVEKYGQEIFEDELEKAAQRLHNFHGYCGDTLKDDGFKDEKFDLIVANPPFSIKWQPDEHDVRFQGAPCVPTGGKADYAFLLHILYHLSEDGKAICLQFPGVLYRGQREGKIRQWMVEQNLIERVVHIPGNTFVDTTISTCVIVFSKHKTTTDIVFEDKELGMEKSVSFDDVKANSFNLSVSSYVYKEPEKEIIDPLALEESARQLAVARLKQEIQFSMMVSKFEGCDMKPFFDALRAVIDECETEYDKEIRR